MYLCQQIVDFDGQSWPMVGAIPTTAVMGSRLTLGYRQATVPARQPNCWAAGMSFIARVCLKCRPPLFQTRGYDPQSPATLEGWWLDHVHVYIHLHFGGHLEIPSSQHCARYNK